MMLSMHSQLHDHYRRYALVVSISLVSVSVILCTFSFVENRLLESWGVDVDWFRLSFGLMTVLILILSILQLTVDWGVQAYAHREARRRLSELKMRYRRTVAGNTRSVATDTVTHLTDEFERTMGSIPAVPEKWFNRLKAKHQFKKALSQEQSRAPAVPQWLLAWRLRWRAVREGGGAREAVNTRGAEGDCCDK